MNMITSELKNKLVLAGIDGNVELLSILVSGYRLKDKVVREANEIFWNANKEKSLMSAVGVHKNQELISLTDTKSIMNRAWEIAKFGAKQFGGSSKMYFNESLRFAYIEVKANLNYV